MFDLPYVIKENLSHVTEVRHFDLGHSGLYYGTEVRHYDLGHSGLYYSCLFPPVIVSIVHNFTSQPGKRNNRTVVIIFEPR